MNCKKAQTEIINDITKYGKTDWLYTLIDEKVALIHPRGTLAVIVPDCFLAVDVSKLKRFEGGKKVFHDETYDTEKAIYEHCRFQVEKGTLVQMRNADSTLTLYINSKNLNYFDKDCLFNATSAVEMIRVFDVNREFCGIVFPVRVKENE